ncbi:hypothetical protein JKF63_01777 [Porcisia hertigi]|uniref:PLD phosphodiesterase domain-containing protein n=1 Tax=Porcisia hertigi TaxID=2761500 RepID=A0A836IEX8_9TRYP|nr:hypothetical protein JKF63_01777 [Porcisia hertigi]
MNGKRSFRALIQIVGLNKVKNSPKRRILNVAHDVFRTGCKYGHGPSPAMSTAGTADSSLPSDSPARSILSLGWRSSFTADGTPPSGPRGLSFVERLQMRRVQLETSANIKAKIHQAFLSAIAACEQLFVSATKALDSSTAVPALSSTATSSPSQTSMGSPSSTDASGTAAFYFDKMQHTIREGKLYYSSTPFDERWDDILASLTVLGRTSRGNRVIPFHDSAEAFEHMWTAVKNAQERVHWQTYICKDDFIGQKTMRRLVEAHQRGCDTELLYDCGGNISGRARLTEELKQCGAKVIPYRPFFRSIAKYFIRGLDWKRSPGLRNHRKILVIDSSHGFCGGLNVGNEYCGKAAGGTGKFRDTHCGVIGPAVAHLAEVYNDTKQPQPWKYGWRRWRQIASQQITRRVKQGQIRMERNKLYRAFQKERSRSGRRLKDVPSVSMRAMRGRWNKQKDQLMTLMRWSRTGSLANSLLYGEVIPAPYRRGNVGEDKKEIHVRDVGAASHVVSPAADMEVSSLVPDISNAKDTSNPASSPVSPVSAESIPGSSPMGERITLLSCPASSNSKGRPNGMRNSAMRRRLLAARREALDRATDLPHKRTYTDMLRRVPILDTEPVPEAEMYLRHRDSMTQVLSCNPRYRDYSIQYAFWQVTRKCHRRIWITTPYYLPTRKLFSALVQAARRGVDVRLLAGSKQTTDPWFMWHASNYITEKLLRAGVKIYEFKGQQIMHAKTVVVDSVWSSIGSYNWDLMSNRNLEVCLCHLDLDMARSMEAQFLRDLEQSVEVRLENHKQRSPWLRFTSWLFYNVVFFLDRITFRSFANEDVND